MGHGAPGPTRPKALVPRLVVSGLLMDVLDRARAAGSIAAGGASCRDQERRDLMADRVAATDATVEDLRGQVEDLREVVNELGTARDRGSRTQKPSATTTDK
jgi:hypothetical protein